jgi:hypothetical protein
MMICGDLLKKLVEFAWVNCIISQKTDFYVYKIEKTNGFLWLK